MVEFFFDSIAMSRYQFDCFYVSVLFSTASRFSWWLVYFEVAGRWETARSNSASGLGTGSYPIQAVFKSTVML
jgi:hypothetical protein